MAAQTDFGRTSPVDHHESKSAAELRKQNKPLMEKRRRARINESLNKLKSLVLDAMKRDTSRYSKLEKADILEMTVKHLRSVQRQQMAAAMASDTTVVGKYRAGFVECASEVSRYLNSIDGLDPSVKSRLLTHLGDCTQKVASLTAMQESQSLSRQSFLQQQQQQQQQMQQQQQQLQQQMQQIPSSTPMASLPGAGYTSLNVSTSAPSPRVNGAFQVMPALPTGGQFALLVPTMDSYRSSISPQSMTSQSAYSHDDARRLSYSSTSTSPGLTSPRGPSPTMTSPTPSDRVFRFCSASEHSSSEDELEVALDMRVEPAHPRDQPRDINANIIRPEARLAERSGNKLYPSSSSFCGKAPVMNVPVKQEVSTDTMWRPW